MPRQICFMIMPFSKKDTGLEPGKGPVEVDFDALWTRALAPLIEDLGYAPVRADADSGSLIIKAMIERLAYADIVMADVSIPNANVYYEIGVRHASRRQGCVLIAADWARPVFDIAQMRRLSYPLPEGEITDQAADAVRKKLKLEIPAMIYKPSPVVETVPDAVGELDEKLKSLDEAKKTVYDPQRVIEFREDMQELSDLSGKIRRIRILPAAFEKERKKTEALKLRDQVEGQKTVLDAVRLEIMRLLRDCVGWKETLAYIDKMPESLRQFPEVREQKLLAMSKTEDLFEAIGHLEELIISFGPSSERFGLIGGSYKKLYRSAKKEGDKDKAAYYLDRAIEAYQNGMMADLNDYYPTCNLPQLLKARAKIQPNDDDLALAKLTAELTLMQCKRAKERGSPDEWLRATLLGAAFDSENVSGARRLLPEIERESSAAWQLESTLDDLRDRASFIKDAECRAKFETIIARLESMV